MQRYHYTAKKSPEELEEGVLEGESTDTIARALVARGLYPVRIDQVDRDGTRWSLRGFLRRERRGKLKLSEQALVARQLGDLLGGGLGVYDALGVLIEQARSTSVGDTLHDLQDAVREGDSLSEALQNHPGLLPPNLIGTIRAGEVSGALEEVLGSIADFLEQEDMLRRRVREALTYPALVSAVGLLTLSVLLAYVIPRIRLLYEDLERMLPLPTRFLLLLSDGFRTFGLPVLLILAVGGYVISRAARRRRHWQVALGRRVLTLPLLGRIYHMREIVGFARNLATLVRGGVPVTQALGLVREGTGNAYVAEEIDKVQAEVREGRRLGQALTHSPVFKGVLVPMVQVGEESGRLDEALRKGARLYERDLDSTLKQVTTLLEPLLILCLGLIVAFIVFATMLPILEIDLVAG